MDQADFELSTLIYDDTLANINEILVLGKESYILKKIEDANAVSREFGQPNCVTKGKERKIRVFYDTAFETIMNYHPTINN